MAQEQNKLCFRCNETLKDNGEITYISSIPRNGDRFYVNTKLEQFRSKYNDTSGYSLKVIHRRCYKPMDTELNDLTGQGTQKTKPCLCEDPQCAKCLVVNCKDDQCKVHTMKNKLKRRAH